MNNSDHQRHETKKQQDATANNLKQIKVSIDALANQIDAQRREQKESKQEDHKWPRRTAWAAIAYTVITLIVLIVNGYQTYLIRSNNVVSQRASVYVDYQLIVSKGMTKEKTPFLNIQIPMINSGNTATKNLKFLIRCAPSTDALPEPWVLLYREKIETLPQIIAPHQTARVICGFPLDQIEAVKAGKLHAYLMGEITYFDRLDDYTLHRTQFDWEIIDVIFTDEKIDPVTKAVIVPERIDLNAQGRGQHNCADEDCPKDTTRY